MCRNMETPERKIEEDDNFETDEKKRRKLDRYQRVGMTDRATQRQRWPETETQASWTTLFNWQRLIKWHAPTARAPTHAPCDVSTCCSTILGIITVMLLRETQRRALNTSPELSTCNVTTLKTNNAKLLIAASALQRTQTRPCCWWEGSDRDGGWLQTTLFCSKYGDLNILHTRSLA